MDVKCFKLINLNPNQFYENKELFLDGAIKLISLVAKTRTLSVEVKSNELKVNYTLTIRAIYLTEDGMIECKEENFDGVSTLKDTFKDDVYAMVKTNVVGVEYHGVDKIRVRVLIEQKGAVIENCSFEFKEDEGINYKNSSISCRNLTPLKETEFLVTNTFTSSSSIGKVLSADATILLKSVSTATDLYEIDGTATIVINHLSGGELCSSTHVFNFKQEFLNEGVTALDTLKATLTPITTSVNIDQSGEEENISIEVLTALNGYVEREEQITYPVDAYSKETELRLCKKVAVIESAGCNIISKERLSTTLPLEDIEDAVEIVSLGTPWVGASTISVGDTLNVEGIICAEIILKREGGEFERVTQEIPYSFMIASSEDCSKNLTVDIDINSFSGRLRFGTSIEINLDLTVYVQGNIENEIQYIEKCDVLGVKEVNDAVISLYLVGEGETLFDCAKALGSDEEELLRLNPEITLPLKAGDKVLLFRPL